MTMPPARRRALMLINPNARRGNEALEPVIERLREGGIDVVIERFETPDEVSPDIARRQHEADLVIVCGGDGTIRSAANVRATPSRSGEVLFALDTGTAVTAGRTERGWIEVTDPKGRTGWVYGDFVD